MKTKTVFFLIGLFCLIAGIELQAQTNAQMLSEIKRLVSTGNCINQPSISISSIRNNSGDIFSYASMGKGDFCQCHPYSDPNVIVTGKFNVSFSHKSDIESQTYTIKLVNGAPVVEVTLHDWSNAFHKLKNVKIIKEENLGYYITGFRDEGNRVHYTTIAIPAKSETCLY